MSEEKQQTSDKQIFKATGFLGGVQVISIILALLRSKVIALLLGPTGMGISSLYLSTVNMVGGISGLGLGFSAVRDISQASEENDIKSLSYTVKVFQHWLWFASILGALIMIVFSPLLSEWTFSDNQHIIAIMVLALSVVFNTMNTGQVAILQGTRRFKDMAKGTVFGSGVALIFTIPLYYFFGVKGIVPALIMASLCTFLVNYYYARRQPLVKTKVPFKESFWKGLDMAKIGVVMMISSCLGTLTIYLVNTYISTHGGVADVGLYQAGVGLTTQYVGLVFMAMGTEYYPRLVTINKDNDKVRDAVNQQSMIVLLIAAPLLSLLIIFVPIVIKILYSSEFLTIITFTRWVALGMFFKVISFALGYVSFAKGDKKFFFIIEGVGFNLLTLVLNVSFYYLWGLNGLGISLLTSYLLYLLVLAILTYKRYNFYYRGYFLKFAFVQFGLCLSVFLIIILGKDSLWSYGLSIIPTAISFYLAYKELDRRVGIKDMLNQIKNKLGIK